MLAAGGGLVVEFGMVLAVDDEATVFDEELEVIDREVETLVVEANAD